MWFAKNNLPKMYLFDALCGMTTLASVTPGILNDKEMQRINEIFCLAAEETERFEIADFAYNANPEIFVSPDGKHKKEYNWEEAYDGARVVYSLFQ